MKKIQLNFVGWMSQLFQVEVSKFEDIINSELYCMFCNCCLVVFNSGVDEDNYEVLFFLYDLFDI